MQRTIQILSLFALVAFFIALSYFIGKSHLPVSSYTYMETAFKLKKYDEVLEIAETLGKEGKAPSYQMLVGWAYLHTRNFRAAHRLFKKILDANPDLDEAKFGLGYALLYLHRSSEALVYAQQLHQQHPKNAQYALFLAESYFQNGNNVESANTYTFMVKNGLDVDAAKKRYMELFGDEKYTEHAIDTLFPSSTKPLELQFSFRTNGDYFEIRDADGWKPIFLRGMNLSATPPGHAVTEPALDVGSYLKWFQLMNEMNVNVVRIYTILPPAFYRALKEHNESHKEKIWLLQGIWFKERSVEEGEQAEGYDIYDPSWVETFKSEIRKTIDAVHGRANISYIQGEAAGFYKADVSAYLFGYLLGRELEPYLVVETNKAHPNTTSFRGEYFQISNGNAVEVWIAMMCDYAVEYERTHYNERHPLSYINWPPIDIFYHPTEGNEQDLKALFRRYNMELKREKLKNAFEVNVVHVDTKKIQPTKNFESSYFITYHVYPSWPNFIFREEPYKSYRDQFGPNSWLGYLKELKKNYPNIPFLLAEVGLSTSWVPSHFAPGTWNHGGLTEQEQAEGLSRMIGGAVDVGCAGCCLFELQDDWWKLTPTSAPFDIAKTKPYWLNLYNAEESYGLISYQAPPPIPLLRGSDSDWVKATTLASALPFTEFNTGDLTAVKAYSDATFFYLRLDIHSLKNVDWEQSQYWIALSTVPGLFGSLQIEDLNIFIPTGANFLIKIIGKKAGSILIARNYNPFSFSDAGLPFVNEKWLSFKDFLYPQLQLESTFEEIFYLTNGFSYARDGTVFPPIYANRSVLHFGTADPASDKFMSHSALNIDEESGMIELRLPWALLYMLDPSNGLAMAGMQKVETMIEYRALPKKTDGFAAVALQIATAGDKNKLVSTMPKSVGSTIPRDKIALYTWPNWLMPPYESRPKRSFDAVKAKYESLKGLSLTRKNSQLIDYTGNK